ncbi:MAG: nickel pincer cofactor biosynthesis protein LarC [Roseiflexus sp.]|nr:nickel pincer cofactor biosynthesis protein LarC [Roseiflexus sp.]MCS7291315.1 nickel pincer cofactor biosynthesis protein LarC [Roseiflexus sp.]MDW8146640.1 nickel pincer cofactor biosynthesis protein LarC [Roseiflexaceae bacterium]MDW8232898.1 nickel pincer cofactor biosynthesis protein LarC [Roseiflexaceae bacterium]
MARVIYFDCFSGISGDMALGALLDAGLSLEALREALQRLNVDGWDLRATREVRGSLAGTRAHVVAPEGGVHRNLEDICAIIGAASLPAAVIERSIRIFTILAEAEAQVHGTTVDQIHFHEVGALDAIIDIVGVVAGLDLLGVEQIFASPLPLGAGWVRAAHGLLPVPAPATLAILASAGAPVTPDETPFELTTPTGAAILAALATFRRPPMRLRAVGYGFGARQMERPNALRVWLGDLDEAPNLPVEAHTHQASLERGAVREQGLVLLETNIDDQSAEQVAYAADRLRATGALDVWCTPILMKKGRAGMLLAALVPADLEELAVEVIMRETTTLGVRRRTVERHVCDRDVIEVATPLGSARVKRKWWRGELISAAPEYEDCARIARERDVPLAAVYQMVMGRMGNAKSILAPGN